MYFFQKMQKSAVGEAGGRETSWKDLSHLFYRKTDWQNSSAQGWMSTQAWRGGAPDPDPFFLFPAVYEYRLFPISCRADWVRSEGHLRWAAQKLNALKSHFGGTQTCRLSVCPGLSERKMHCCFIQSRQRNAQSFGNAFRKVTITQCISRACLLMRVLFWNVKGWDCFRGGNISFLPPGSQISRAVWQRRLCAQKRQGAVLLCSIS